MNRNSKWMILLKKIPWSGGDLDLKTMVPSGYSSCDRHQVTTPWHIQHYSLRRAMDGRIVRRGIISSCRTAATSEIVKAFLVSSPSHIKSAIASIGQFFTFYVKKNMRLWFDSYIWRYRPINAHRYGFVVCFRFIDLFCILHVVHVAQHVVREIHKNRSKWLSAKWILGFIQFLCGGTVAAEECVG